ncbi:hypothetical protein CZ809_03872 [Photobacterium piscicola]|jgi:hypothetical protein|uniref:Uncharacterized protein n=1 Tax=Photobacterium piscicola TaxID=1378299 RepID=A0A1T5I570_9GAMM|nr:hypothetical protein [Photobacterium piscicola]SKC34260.1 hypothetical protein CZ809_03872 [Photobacterium piscicola]
MKKKSPLEYRFISRLKKTIDLFGYISLEAIINGQLKQKTTFNMLDLIKIPKINNIQRIQSPPPESLKKSRDKNQK